MNNRFLGNFGVKTLAVFLAVIAFVSCFGCVFGVIAMIDFDFYTSDKEDALNEIYKRNLCDDTYEVYDRISFTNELDDYPLGGNVFLKITDNEGNVLQTDYNGSEVICESVQEWDGSYRYLHEQYTEDMDWYKSLFDTNCTFTEVTYGYVESTTVEPVYGYAENATAVYTEDENTDDGYYEENEDGFHEKKITVTVKGRKDGCYVYVPAGLDGTDGAVYRIYMVPLTITCGLYKNIQQTDKYYYIQQLVDFAYPLKFTAILIAAASLIVFIFLLVFLCCSAGRHKDSEQPYLGRADKFPFDLATLILAAIAALEVVFFADVVFDYDNLLVVIIAAAIAVTVDITLVLLYIMSLAARIKTGGLFKSFLFVRIGKFLGKQLGRFFRFLHHGFSNLHLVWKTAIITGVLALSNGFLALTTDDGWYMLIWLGETLVLVPLVIYAAVSMRKIQKGGTDIAKGNLDSHIDTSYMFGDFKDFANCLNNINVGMSNAVNERMKSERFKTELITNVSHDIKTPLTSIINYVDLIGKEEIENENVKDYIEVLDRQSARLKKLIEDLIEASKASTGSLNVNLAPCDAGILLYQVSGEYMEKAEKSGLQLVVNAGDEPANIMADNRHLWRVFDNLMNNICKYAQPGTRVYLSIRKMNGKAIISFKNISREQLNISSEELMERFVRGDSSRNTEGSGLGLSIARSLTELQHGQMNLVIDGDMFTATLIFDLIK